MVRQILQKFVHPNLIKTMTSTSKYNIAPTPFGSLKRENCTITRRKTPKFTLALKSNPQPVFSKTVSSLLIDGDLSQNRISEMDKFAKNKRKDLNE